MSMFNNILGLYSGDLYLGGLYSGGLIFGGGGGAYIWGAYSQRFTIFNFVCVYFVRLFI